MERLRHMVCRGAQIDRKVYGNGEWEREELKFQPANGFVHDHTIAKCINGIHGVLIDIVRLDTLLNYKPNQGYSMSLETFSIQLREYFGTDIRFYHSIRGGSNDREFNSSAIFIPTHYFTHGENIDIFTYVTNHPDELFVIPDEMEEIQQ